MQIKIRRAVKEDCPRMLELVHELATFEKAPQEVSITLEHFEESGFGPIPVYWAFVAEAEGYIVAFALYYIRFSTWKGQRMYLEDILVTESWRGKKIGKLLFDRLITEAKEKICMVSAGRCLNGMNRLSIFIKNTMQVLTESGSMEVLLCKITATWGYASSVQRIFSQTSSALKPRGG